MEYPKMNMLLYYLPLKPTIHDATRWHTRCNFVVCRALDDPQKNDLDPDPDPNL